MAPSNNPIVVLSANCQGLRNKHKRIDVFQFLKEKKAHIICLQDTHLTEKDEKIIKHEWAGECIIHGNRTNARGVLILFNSKFEYKKATETS